MNKRLISILLLIVTIVLIFIISRPLGFIFLAGIIIAGAYFSRSSIYKLIGTIKYSRDQSEEGMKYFEKAVNTKGCSLKTKNSYAYLLIKHGDLEKGEKLLKEIIDSYPDESSLNLAKNNYALALWRKGDLDGGIAVLKELYSHYRTSALYGTLGYFLIVKGDLKEAYDFILESYDYDDKDKVILDNLGQIYYLKHQYDKSKDAFEKLMQENPYFPEAYYDYGVLLEKTGKTDEALEMYEKALNFEFTKLSAITKEQVLSKINKLKPQNDGASK